MVPLSYYLILSGFIFVAGAVGVIVRRNAIVVLMCIELMLNAANLAFVAFSRVHGNLHGQAAALFVIAAAAAAAAVGLAIVITVFRNMKSAETTDACDLRG